MKDEIRCLVRTFVSDFMKRDGTRSEWKEPLVGFASASDLLFGTLKGSASPIHRLPGDFLPGARTVIAYFIPFSPDINLSNVEGRYSSLEWCTAYLETNEMILQLNMYLNTWFDSKGYRGVVLPATHNWDVEKLISDWSHRSVAYIAGLGTFGRNNMLITEKGCCGRFGSFITSAPIPADTRVPGEACLYKHNGTCGVCVKRCPNKALTLDTFDRFACYDMLLENGRRNGDIGNTDVCGKCLVGLPCSERNPVRSAG